MSAAALKVITGARVEDYLTQERWLEARKTGIGASEAAALFGLSMYDSPMSLWALKTGQVIDERDEEWLDWGRALEAPIAVKYEQRSGRKVKKAGDWAIVRHATLPFMFATPDRWVYEAPDRTPDRDELGLVEIKNVGAWSDEWHSGVPLRVQIQVQHQMACTGVRWASIAFLRGGNKFEYVDVERDDEFIAELEARCAAFWLHVEQREPPPMDGHAETLKTVKRLHPLDTGEEVTLEAEVESWWNALADLKAAEKANDSAQNEVEAKIRAAIGSATFGRLPTGRLLTLKSQTTGAHTKNCPEVTYRVLREKKGAAASPAPTAPDAPQAPATATMRKSPRRKAA